MDVGSTASVDNPAAPMEHEEVVDGVVLIERLSAAVPTGSLFHGPTHTVRFEALYGVIERRSVVLYRPRRALWTPTDRGSPGWGESLVEDLSHRSPLWGQAAGYRWAAVEAPLGVRLRALAVELGRRATPLPESLGLAIALWTAEALPSGSPVEDTIVTWEGDLWLSPELVGTKQLELPSFVGGECFDALVVRDARSFAELLSGTWPPPFLARQVEALDETERAALPSSPVFRPPQPPPVPGHVSPWCARIIAEGGRGEGFTSMCRQASRRVRPADRRELADLVLRLFGDVRSRHGRRGPPELWRGYR